MPRVWGSHKINDPFGDYFKGAYSKWSQAMPYQMLLTTFPFKIML